MAKIFSPHFLQKLQGELVITSEGGKSSPGTCEVFKSCIYLCTEQYAAFVFTSVITEGGGLKCQVLV